MSAAAAAVAAMLAMRLIGAGSSTCTVCGCDRRMLCERCRGGRCARCKGA